MRSAAPNWPEPARQLQQPASLLSLMLGRDGAARYGGNTAVEEKLEKCVGRLRKMLDGDVIAGGDTVVLLDVGEHCCDPDLHERQWRLLVETAVLDHPVQVVVCGGFDDGGKGRTDCLYDVRFNGRTMNEAIAAAAETPAGATGRVTWLPLSDALRDFNRSCLERHELSAYYEDGMHLNVWGNLKLCALLVAVVTENPPGAEAVAGLYAEHWRELGAPSAAAAAGAVELSLGHWLNT